MTYKLRITNTDMKKSIFSIVFDLVKYRIEVGLWVIGVPALCFILARKKAASSIMGKDLDPGIS